MPKTQHLTGVSVQTRKGARGTTYGARYTERGQKITIKAPAGGWVDWQAAFEAACAEQRRVNRTTDTRGGRTMTVDQLITEFYIPEHWDDGPNTWRGRMSHLGDGTGIPKAMGRKNTLGAATAIRFVFGSTRLCDLQRRHVLDWQRTMLDSGRLKRSSIESKRSLLRAILNIAVANGWLDTNVVDSVKLPKAGPAETVDKVAVEPEQWLLIRSRLAGPVTQLFIDLTLEAGLRRGEAMGLRPMDVVGPTDAEPTAHLYLRRKVLWLGMKEVAAERVKQGLPVDPEPVRWMIEDWVKAKKWRRVALSQPMYRSLVAHIEQFDLRPEDFVFDANVLKVESNRKKDSDPLPTEFPSGRFLNTKTGRSGEHGRYNTYSYGCRCEFCRRAYTEYRFWWARGKGRASATPWTDEGFLDNLPGNTAPVDPAWFDRTVWQPAMAELGLNFTLHDLRRAMVTWSLESGVPIHIIQADAGHATVQTTEGYRRRLLSKRVSTGRADAMEAVLSKAKAGLPAFADPPRLTSLPAEPVPEPTSPAPAPVTTDPAMAAVLASAMSPQEKAAVLRALTGSPAPVLRVVE